MNVCVWGEECTWILNRTKGRMKLAIPINFSRGFFFFHPICKKDRAILLLPLFSCYNTDRYNKIKPICNPGMEWKKSSVYSVKTKPLKGKTSWKVIQHRAPYSMCWSTALGCLLQKMGNLENCFIKAVLISRAEIVAALWLCLLKDKSTAYCKKGSFHLRFQLFRTS